MDKYSIRYCRLDEVSKLQQFIDDYWKKGHILATNKSLLDYQHLNEAEKRYNFVVLEDNETQKFECILGFIPHSHYASDMGKDIWLAIWKKSPTPLPPGLGTKLLDFLEQDFKPTSIGSIGINDDIERLYLKRGWRSGLLCHWYFLNAGKLISFEQKQFSTEDYYHNPAPKSQLYYTNRYIKHPFYQYKTHQGVIYRKITTPIGTCLRIVDFEARFYLDPHSTQQLLQMENADYIDFLNFGFSEEFRLKMGFHKRDENMIIPQWFEPFDIGKRDIKFAYKCDGDYFIVKGDSDQDRPNIISNS